MNRRLISFLLLFVLLFGMTIPAYAHPKQGEHDTDLATLLFGEGYTLTGEKKAKFQAIADAAALCIDQFSANEEMRSKEDLFDSLNARIGFSFSFDDIELQKAQDGKTNVSAKTHRRYTHRGWNFTEYPLKDLWVQRKKILTATVNKELFGKSPGVLSKIPWAEGLAYSEAACNKQCEAFCELVYCIHILGDYEEATSYSSEFQQLIPLVRHEDPQSPALIDDIINLIPILFEKQSWTYPILIQELEGIKADAEKVMFVTGGIRTQEQFNEYHQCALDVMQAIQDHVPDMLRKTDFFSEAFYK